MCVLSHFERARKKGFRYYKLNQDRLSVDYMTTSDGVRNMTYVIDKRYIFAPTRKP